MSSHGRSQDSLAALATSAPFHCKHTVSAYAVNSDPEILSRSVSGVGMFSIPCREPSNAVASESRSSFAGRNCKRSCRSHSAHCSNNTLTSSSYSAIRLLTG